MRMTIASVLDPAWAWKIIVWVVLLAATLTIWAAPSRAEIVDAHDLPLLEPLQGKVVLLDFWASWCAPCRRSFPWMTDLQRRYDADGLVVVAVNLDQERRLAQGFLDRTPAGFRVEFDPRGELADLFGVTGMPMSFLIDRHGRVRQRHVGFREAQRGVREAQIQELLEE
ncbi:MAG: TlpA disulfide reductase family protein [Steroidobacteraceae bacterium]|nr:TlpA disulfide reductase family protein [Steroidobacteraceae bacterium]